MSSELDRDWMACEVLTLRDRVNELEEENRQLREAMTPAMPYPAVWGLTVMESKLLQALRLAKGAPLPKERILVLLYGFGAEVETKIIDVMICKMKRKLRPFGIDFKNRWGVGYGVTPESLPILAAVAGTTPTRRAA